MYTRLTRSRTRVELSSSANLGLRICYVWRHSTREFGHIHGNCDSVFVASRTFGTAPLPRRKETRVDEEGRAAENCKIGTGRRTKFHVQPIPTYD